MKNIQNFQDFTINNDQKTETVGGWGCYGGSYSYSRYSCYSGSSCYGSRTSYSSYSGSSCYGSSYSCYGSRSYSGCGSTSTQTQQNVETPTQTVEEVEVLPRIDDMIDAIRGQMNF